MFPFIEELKRRHVIRVAAVYAVVGWLVIQVADTVAPALNLPDWTMTIIVFIGVFGFPFVLLFAWAYELTPQGLIRDTGLLEVAADAPLEAPGDQVLIDPTPSKQSIAVLPFVNMSSDPEQEYFSDGLAEELLNLLAQIPALHVAARTSSFSFKGKDVDIPEVAERLKVANVLEGSVRKAGNRIRITAQLILAANGYHLWSEAFDRTLEDIFAVQDEIARAVVEALKVNLLGEVPKVRETNPEAYALYLQGMQLLETVEADNLEKAQRVFSQALELDPQYAPAWDGLATNFVYQIRPGQLKVQDGIALSNEAVERALALDENLAEAHSSKAFLKMVFEWDWPVAEASIERALQLAPGNARVVLRAGHLASILGRRDEAITLLKQAISLNPLHTTGYIWYALALMSANRLEEALASVEQVLNLVPQRLIAHSLMGRILLLQGQAEAAHVQMQKEPEATWRAFGMALSLYALNRHEEADATLHAFIDTHPDDAPYQIAEIYGYRGDIDAAFYWLEQAREERDAGLNELVGSRYLTTLHDDPRWPAFLDKMGLPKPVP